jgi:mannose-6-phosphate isomerase
MSNQRRVDKPWGYENIWALTDKYAGKLIHIDKGHKLSLQFHNKKLETLYVLKGTLHLVYDNDIVILTPGESMHIPTGVVHRMMAPDDDVDLMEVSSPELDDVVRLQDEYGRAQQ